MVASPGGAGPTANAGLIEAAVFDGRRLYQKTINRAPEGFIRKLSEEWSAQHQ
jgi:hypothetical protein